MDFIGNMHVNDDASVGFGKHDDNQADEELNDGDYNDEADDHGEENGNNQGRNVDSNNLEKVVLALEEKTVLNDYATTTHFQSFFSHCGQF
jgi:hypothetical protein